MSDSSQVTMAYLLLCHDCPTRITALVSRILSEDESGHVIIHFDKNSSFAKFTELNSKLSNFNRCHIVNDRVKCGWGQWSLVRATLVMADYAVNHTPFTHCYLLSETCFPTQSLFGLKNFLYNNPNANFIECETEEWIKDGIKKDRLVYRHFVNKKKYRKLHRWIYRIQKKINLKKKLPSNMHIRYGSQWWCLCRDTVIYVLSSRAKYHKYFKYSWIPDEMFFQTVIFNNENIKDSIKSRNLTKYEFNECGEVKHIDNPSLYSSRYFFCRKVY